MPRDGAGGSPLCPLTPATAGAEGAFCDGEVRDSRRGGNSRPGMTSPRDPGPPSEPRGGSRSPPREKEAACHPEPPATARGWGGVEAERRGGPAADCRGWVRLPDGFRLDEPWSPPWAPETGCRCTPSNARGLAGGAPGHRAATLAVSWHFCLPGQCEACSGVGPGQRREAAARALVRLGRQHLRHPSLS